MKLILGEYLQDYTVQELQDLCRALSIRGYSKLRKEKIVALIVDHYLSEEGQLNFLETSATDVIEGYYKLVMDRKLRLTRGNLHLYASAIHIGYVTTTEEKGTDHIIMTLEEEFEDFFCEWFDRCGEKYMEKRRIRDYAVAAAHLWGIAPVTKIAELIQEHTRQSYSKEEIVDTLKRELSIVDESVVLIHDEVIDREILTEECLPELRSQQMGKAYYKPPYGEFIPFISKLYWVITSEQKALEDHLISECNLPRAGVEKIVADAIRYSKFGYAPPQIMSAFAEYITQEYGEQDLSQLSPLFSAFYHHLRMWSHCGFAPAEITTQTQKSQLKVGRNDPCTCGSGKKYKKCCGR